MAKKRNSWTEGYRTYDTSEGFGNKDKWQEAFRQRMTGEEAHRIIKESVEADDSILFQRRIWDESAVEAHARKVLGVTEHATPKEIRNTYYKLMQRWHVDSNQDNTEEAKMMCQKFTAAYTILVP